MHRSHYCARIEDVSTHDPWPQTLHVTPSSEGGGQQRPVMCHFKQTVTWHGHDILSDTKVRNSRVIKPAHHCIKDWEESMTSQASESVYMTTLGWSMIVGWRCWSSRNLTPHLGVHCQLAVLRSAGRSESDVLLSPAVTAHTSPWPTSTRLGPAPFIFFIHSGCSPLVFTGSISRVQSHTGCEVGC